MNPTKPIRRNKAQWQALVDQQQQSQLSATAFCKTQHIGYASFCQWRKRLSQAEGRITPSEPAFIDVSALQSSAAPSNTNHTGWHIVLSLGEGIELQLSHR